jgi:hypothetical protein
MAVAVLKTAVTRLAGVDEQVRAEVAGPNGRTAGAGREVMTR